MMQMAPTFTERLRANQQVKCHRGASKDEIDRLAKTSKVKIPAGYRAFLMECGWARIGSDIIYGLGPDATKAESVKENLQWEWVLAEPQMPWPLIPVMNDGAGSHYCLDTGKAKDGTCPVVFWDHEHPRGQFQKPKLVSKSFELWILRLVKEAEKLAS
jgi:hypothetical protein